MGELKTVFTCFLTMLQGSEVDTTSNKGAKMVAWFQGCYDLLRFVQALQTNQLYGILPGKQGPSSV